jgi:hypothetical protein
MPRILGKKIKDLQSPHANSCHQRVAARSAIFERHFNAFDGFSALIRNSQP